MNWDFLKAFFVFQALFVGLFGCIVLLLLSKERFERLLEKVEEFFKKNIKKILFGIILFFFVVFEARITYLCIVGQKHFVQIMWSTVAYVAALFLPFVFALGLKVLSFFDNRKKSSESRKHA
ncbi:MAG TPA: hypothetical protein VFM02_02635 [Candidatus Paceibacterota bacterium]|nr:hypothetical protein [Candidatus Paceibacterota bacterium]